MSAKEASRRSATEKAEHRLPQVTKQWGGGAVQDGPESLPRAKPPRTPGSLQAKLKAVTGSGPCGGALEGHNPLPKRRAASLPDGSHRGPEGVAAVFDRKGRGKGMRGFEPCDKLIALNREVAQVGREGTEDGTSPYLLATTLLRRSWKVSS